ncbi:MAG TPA: DUF6130 family protein [Bryobacteraceae bacterium]|nr:DUF6130 family protein [Bryobacteraceae bacterium]
MKIRTCFSLPLIASAAIGLMVGQCGVGADYEAAAILPLKDQPAARLEITPPIPELLAKGRVVIQFRTENLRVLPVYGNTAAAVSPRIGHLHITVDNLPWRWLHPTAEPVNITNLPPGKHKVLLELVDPAHKVIDSKTSVFEVPERRNLE